MTTYKTDYTLAERIELFKGAPEDADFYSPETGSHLPLWVKHSDKSRGRQSVLRVGREEWVEVWTTSSGPALVPRPTKEELSLVELATPVYTQQMADDGELPSVGSFVEYIFSVDTVIEGGPIIQDWSTGDRLEVMCHSRSQYSQVNDIAVCRGPNGVTISLSKSLYRPIPVKSTKEVYKDEATESLAEYLGVLCPLPEVVNKAIEWHMSKVEEAAAIQSGKEVIHV